MTEFARLTHFLYSKGTSSSFFTFFLLFDFNKIACETGRSDTQQKRNDKSASSAG
jgi:hypothetical protein